MTRADKDTVESRAGMDAGIITQAIDPLATPSALPGTDNAREVWPEATRLPQSLVQLERFSIAASCINADAVGGDFYDVLHLPNGDTLLLIADVMGKGIPAALIASVAKTVFQNTIREVCTPLELFQRVNELLYEDLANADMFITAQGVWIDSKHDRLHVVSAGHCPLIVHKSNQTIASVAPLSGFPIGVEQDGAYSEVSIPLSSVDCCVMYTDGVTEAEAKPGRCFGQDGLEKWLKDVRSTGLSVDVMKEDLELVLEKFGGGAHQRDDRTFVILGCTIT